VARPVKVVCLEVFLAAAPAYLLIDVKCTPILQLNDPLTHLVPLVLKLLDYSIGLAEVLKDLRVLILQGRLLHFQLGNPLS
jgi:hypothetical protein